RSAAAWGSESAGSGGSRASGWLPTMRIAPSRSPDTAAGARSCPPHADAVASTAIQPRNTPADRDASPPAEQAFCRQWRSVTLAPQQVHAVDITVAGRALDHQTPGQPVLDRALAEVLVEPRLQPLAIGQQQRTDHP